MHASQQSPDMKNFKEPRYVKNTHLLDVRRKSAGNAVAMTSSAARQRKAVKNVTNSNTLLASTMNQSQSSTTAAFKTLKSGAGAGRQTESFRTAE